MNNHWTNNSVDDFLTAILLDYVHQIDRIMDERKLSPHDIAQKIGYDTGTVRQAMEDPLNNMILDLIVRIARALEMKVAFMLYDDGDPKNAKGPVFTEVFREAWEMCGRPVNGYDLIKMKGELE